SQPAIRQFIDTIGEKKILEVSQKIISLRPLILWIDSPDRVICYAQIHDGDGWLPVMFTYEDRSWKLVAGLLSSPFSNVLDYVAMYRFWNRIEVKETPTQLPVDAASALQSGTFDRLPALLPPPPPKPSASAPLTPLN